MRRSWSVWLGNVLQSSRGRSGSAILSAHDIQMAELDASWRAALAHVCFTAKGRGPKVGAARGAEFKVIPHCGFGRSRARNTNIPRRTQNRICTDMYAQASVYTCSRVGRICRHRSQATSFDGRQLTRYSTQKILVLSPAFTQGLFRRDHSLRVFSLNLGRCGPPAPLDKGTVQVVLSRGVRLRSSRP